jgi:hypothetical protein
MQFVTKISLQFEIYAKTGFLYCSCGSDGADSSDGADGSGGSDNGIKHG